MSERERSRRLPAPLEALVVWWKFKQHESIAKTPCTLLFSFDGYMHSIKTPAQALGSLLQHSELNSEATEIVRAMMRLRSEYVDAQSARRKAQKSGGGSRKKEG